MELIEREITVSTPEQPGCIRAKMNALEDKKVIEALYRASQHGVKIQLNVRGICCLKPGIPGLSENIQVFSIIDRFLEHARIFYFQNAGDPEVYLASADWMTRNLDKRLEILFPVLAQPLRKRILSALNLYLADNQKSHELQPDGTWKKRKPGKNQEKIRAQEILYCQAVDAANAPSATPLQYIPLQKPEK
ncbi:MAG: polyphosphate kinase [Thermoguttaceae bacterium]|nr:polyphosphate kinase [Thermoguttaceae bacterium]